VSVPKATACASVICVQCARAPLEQGAMLPCPGKTRGSKPQAQGFAQQGDGTRHGVWARMSYETRRRIDSGCEGLTC